MSIIFLKIWDFFNTNTFRQKFRRSSRGSSVKRVLYGLLKITREDLYPMQCAAGFIATHADRRKALAENIGTVSGGIHPRPHNAFGRALSPCDVLSRGAHVIQIHNIRQRAIAIGTFVIKELHQLAAAKLRVFHKLGVGGEGRKTVVRALDINKSYDFVSERGHIFLFGKRLGTGSAAGAALAALLAFGGGCGFFSCYPIAPAVPRRVCYIAFVAVTAASAGVQCISVFGAGGFICL